MRMMWHDDAWEEYLNWQQLDKKNTKENKQSPKKH